MAHKEHMWACFSDADNPPASSHLFTLSSDYCIILPLRLSRFSVILQQMSKTISDSHKSFKMLYTFYYWLNGNAAFQLNQLFQRKKLRYAKENSRSAILGTLHTSLVDMETSALGSNVIISPPCLSCFFCCYPGITFLSADIEIDQPLTHVLFVD